MTSYRIRDLLERLFWTVVAAFLGALAAGPVVDISALEAAYVAAAGAAVNFLLLVARWRLSVLPDPGAGLPGIPTTVQPPVIDGLSEADDVLTTGAPDSGQGLVGGLLVVFLLLLILKLLGAF